MKSVNSCQKCKHAFYSMVIMAIILFISLAGCTSAVKDVSSPVSLPPGFSATGKDFLPDKWWEVFEDEILNDLVERAFVSNFDLLTAWDRMSQVEATAVKSGAGLFPEVDFSGSASRTVEDSGRGSIHYNGYNAGFVVSYELDIWGRIHAARQAALLDMQASREDVTATAIILSAMISRTWYQLAEVQAQIVIIEKQIETNEKILDLITARFRQGKISVAEVFRQQQLVESGRGQLILVREQAGMLQNKLSVLLGVPPGTSADFKATLVDMPSLPVTPLPANLIQRRPDVRSAYLALQASDQRVASAVADQFPRISLSSVAETSGTKITDLFDNWLTNIAGNLAQPLYDGKRREAEVTLRKADLSQAVHQYGQKILISLQEVEDALTQEKRQAEYLRSLGKQLEISRIVIDRTKESYAKGQLDYLRVLDALVSSQTLERNCLTARRLLLERRIDLYRAIAGSWEMKRPEII